MKVPVYSQQVERKPLTGGGRSTSADPRAFGGNPFGADAFGANVGEAMGQAGRSLQGVAGVFSAIGERMQEERDSNMVLEASLQWQKEVLQFQHDPEKGLFRRTGGRCWGLPRDGRVLSESAGRRAAELRTTGSGRPSKGTPCSGYGAPRGASRFEAEQHRNGDWPRPRAWRSSLSTARRRITGRRPDPASLDEGCRRWRRPWPAWGKSRRGGEGRATTKLHTQVINRYLVDDPFGAEKYYSLVKEQVSGAARTAIENAIQTGTRVERTQAKADELMGKFLGNGGSPVIRKTPPAGGERPGGGRQDTLQRTANGAGRGHRVRNERIADVVEGAASATELTPAGEDGYRRRSAGPW